MTRHSKNNSGGSVFTNYERNRLDYGTIRQRLGSDSQRSFDACCLCLQKCRDPVVCGGGHLYCKECALENILSQKKEINEKKKRMEEEKAKVKSKEETEKKLAKEKTIEKFEKSLATVSVKRSLDETEGIEAKKMKGDSFWHSSVVSLDAAAVIEKVKETPICSFCSPPIPFSVKKLTAVKFGIDRDKKFCCPACSRLIVNGMELLMSKKCGHVVCVKCINTINEISKSKNCLVCHAEFVSKDEIVLKSEGTGYAEKGNVETEKFTVAFQ